MLAPIDQNTGNNGYQETANPILAHPGLRALLQQQIAIRDGVAPAGTPATAMMPSNSAAGTTAPPITPAPQPTAQPQQATQPTANEARLAQLQNSKPGLENVYHKITSSDWGQNHPGLGKLAGIAGQIPATAADLAMSLKGLPVLGSSLSSIGQVMPGTTEQHNAKLGEAEGAVTADEANAEKEAQAGLQGAQAGHLKEETMELPGKTASEEGLQGAQQNNLENPAWEHLETDQGIFARNPKTNELMPLTFQGKPLMPKPPTAKGQEHISLEGPGGKPIAANYHPDTGKYTDASGNEIANPKPYEKPNVTNVNAGGEKAFEYSDKALTSLSAPISQIQMRMGRLKDTLAQGTPQADALAAPELLTIMAGGQGSGLRMNEAEIARIVGGRSHWENLKAAAQKWSTNPETANSITADQRQQVRALVATVDAKLTQKQNILNDAGQNLLDAKSPEEQHRVIIEARRALTQIDAGGNQPAQGGATDIVYDDKGVGHRYKGSGARNDPNSYEQVK